MGKFFQSVGRVVKSPRFQKFVIRTALSVITGHLADPKKPMTITTKGVNTALKILGQIQKEF